MVAGKGRRKANDASLPAFIVLEKEGSEENLDFYIGNKLVHSCNHDEHGWAGMELATNLFEVTAKTLGAKFERR